MLLILNENYRKIMNSLSHFTTITLIQIALLAALILGTNGCDREKPQIAAPLNDIATLEKLAAAYKEISQQFPVSPTNLAPAARRKFVEQVFATAGYGYSATLSSLSSVKKADITKLHRDMQELLFLPHYGLPKDSIDELYSEQELADIQKIESNFKQSFH